MLFSLMICGTCNHFSISPDLLPFMLREAILILALTLLWRCAWVCAMGSVNPLPLCGVLFVLGFAWVRGRDVVALLACTPEPLPLLDIRSTGGLGSVADGPPPPGFEVRGV